MSEGIQGDFLEEAELKLGLTGWVRGGWMKNKEGLPRC